jgi:hypothetical protein
MGRKGELANSENMGFDMGLPVFLFRAIITDEVASIQT